MQVGPQRGLIMHLKTAQTPNQQPTTLIIFIFEFITLYNKDSGGWDISTDTTSLELTDTQMNTHFAQSAQIFPQNCLFRPFLRKMAKCFPLYPAQNEAFMVFKHNQHDLMVLTKKLV